MVHSKALVHLYQGIACFFFLSVECLAKIFVEEVHYSRVFFCTQYEGIVRKYGKLGKSLKQLILLEISIRESS